MSLGRIRILQIVAGLDIGLTFGGAERSGLELARALDPATFDVTVCSFWRCDTPTEKSWQAVLESAGIPVFFATASGARRNSMDFFAGAKHVVYECRARQIHITHAHHEGGALAALCAKARGTRAAMRTVHMPLPEEWGHGFSASLFRAAFSRIAFPLLMDAEVAVSPDFQRQLARRVLNRRAPEMIYNTRPLQPQPPRLRTGNVIGSIGRLAEQKGHLILIEAMPRVLAAVPGARLMIVGEGELRPRLEQRIHALNLGARVELLGQRDDVPDLLNEMAVLAMPSCWEGVSTAFLEAVAAGVPVVASDIPGFREFIQPNQTGWLMPEGNALALADALVEALQYPERALQFARRAQQDILPQVSMQAICSQYEGIYRRLYGSVARP